jgi:hypothetical protein
VLREDEFVTGKASFLWVAKRERQLGCAGTETTGNFFREQKEKKSKQKEKEEPSIPAMPPIQQKKSSCQQQNISLENIFRIPIKD